MKYIYIYTHCVEENTEFLFGAPYEAKKKLYVETTSVPASGPSIKD
jgi:hypothetical protein